MTTFKSFANTLLSSMLVVGAGFAGVLATAAPGLAETNARTEVSIKFFDITIIPSLTNHTLMDYVDQPSSDSLTDIVGENLHNSLFGETKDNLNYFGSVKETSSKVGSFDVGPGDTFSFNFIGDVKINTNLASEFHDAGGLGITRIGVVAGNKPLDNFTGSASFRHGGQGDVNTQKTSFFTLSSVTHQKTSNGNEESFWATITGSYERLFSESKTIHVSENRVGAAFVGVPEPLTVLGTAVALGIGGLLRKQYLQEKSQNSKPPSAKTGTL
jgi:hypothetical protein